MHRTSTGPPDWRPHAPGNKGRAPRKLHKSTPTKRVKNNEFFPLEFLTNGRQKNRYGSAACYQRAFRREREVGKSLSRSARRRSDRLRRERLSRRQHKRHTPSASVSAPQASITICRRKRRHCLRSASWGFWTLSTTSKRHHSAPLIPRRKNCDAAITNHLLPLRSHPAADYIRVFVLHRHELPNGPRQEIGRLARTYQKLIQQILYGRSCGRRICRRPQS